MGKKYHSTYNLLDFLFHSNLYCLDSSILFHYDFLLTLYYFDRCLWFIHFRSPITVFHYLSISIYFHIVLSWVFLVLSYSSTLRRFGTVLKQFLQGHRKWGSGLRLSIKGPFQCIEPLLGTSWVWCLIFIQLQSVCSVIFCLFSSEAASGS